MRGKEYIKAYQDYNNERERGIQIRKSSLMAEEAEVLQKINEVHDKSEKVANAREEYYKFSQNVKKSLLSEALLAIYDKSIGIKLEFFDNEAFKVSMINKFIEENGVEKLLGSFENKTIFLSEIAKNIRDTHSNIMKEASPLDTTTLTIDKDNKDTFYDNLDMSSIQDVADQIKTRVSDAMEEFIQNNINDRIDIQDIIQTTKDKIDNGKTMTDGIKEGYEQRSKRDISDVRDSRRRNIFEQMTRNLSGSIVKDEKLKEMYTENGKLNMDKIIESSKLLYTLIEMVSTTKMIKVDEQYLNEMLNSLK